MDKKLEFKQPVIEVINIDSAEIISTSTFGQNWAGDEQEKL